MLMDITINRAYRNNKLARLEIMFIPVTVIV